MDRGAWWATVHGIAGVGHNLALYSFFSFPLLKMPKTPMLTLTTSELTLRSTVAPCPRETVLRPRFTLRPVTL